jgi:hypothetical protein
MQATFDTYWDYARHAADDTNMMLGEPPARARHVRAAAAGYRQVADRFAAGYADLPSFTGWLMDPAQTSVYLTSLR